MTYLLEMEDQSNGSVEHFQREFGSMEQAKAYATEQAKSDIFWTVREGHWDGLCPGYAFRISEQH